MSWRFGYPISANAEMALAMFLSFAVLFPPHWAGALPGPAPFSAGHVLMLPATLDGFGSYNGSGDWGGYWVARPLRS